MTPEEKARVLAAGVCFAAAIGMLVVAAVDAYRRGQRNVDRMLAFVPPAPVVRCGECLDVLDADNPRAPSCLAHDTCLACAPTPSCSECDGELAKSGLAPEVFVGGLFLDVETFRMDFESDADWGWTR